MPEPLLSQYEQAQAVIQVQELITSSEQVAILLRKQDGENLYGTDEGSFQLELNQTTPVDITKSIDAKASVLPELDVRVTDRVRFGDIEYRIQTVAEESLFGIVTHKVIELVILHGS
jgi:hypothetical protein